jgi:hypothetical protein
MECPGKEAPVYTAGNQILTPLYQVGLMHQCTLIKKVSDDIFIIHENVPVSADCHMKEGITRVHIVNLAGFLWKDDPKNVVPTCTCPANLNIKDCCAGIMVALKHQEEFGGWYGKTFLEKRELLSRRLRADLDPVRICHMFPDAMF